MATPHAVVESDQGPPRPGALIGGVGAMVLGRMLDEEGATIFVSRPGA